jgi:hypothetical protein
MAFARSMTGRRTAPWRRHWLPEFPTPREEYQVDAGGARSAGYLREDAPVPSAAIGK